MDLKDLVISTLAEIEEVVREDNQTQEQKVARAAPFVIEHDEKSYTSEPAINNKPQESSVPSHGGYRIIDEDRLSNGAELEKFLVNLKERILVLFEGLQTIESSGNKDLLLLEKKLDLTVNFLEYLLASIDDKLEHPTR